MERELSLDEIHQITLELMDSLHRICEKNHITYYLMYGTLIGAIRHDGFIPWDDDFDICMMREDYDRLLALLEWDQSDEDHKLVTRTNTKNYYNGIARYCDTRYEYRSKLSVRQAQQGIFIDIYPMDSCADTMEETEKIHRKVRKWNGRYMVYCNSKSLTSKFRTLIRVPLHYYYHIRYGNNFAKVTEKRIEDLIYSHFDKNSEYVGVYWENRDFRLLKRSWFEKRIMRGFEDRQYWIPAQYHEILTLQYGDYMTPPPQGERQKNQHFYRVFEKSEMNG